MTRGNCLAFSKGLRTRHFFKDHSAGAIRAGAIRGTRTGGYRIGFRKPTRRARGETAAGPNEATASGRAGGRDVRRLILPARMAGGTGESRRRGKRAGTIGPTSNCGLAPAQARPYPRNGLAGTSLETPSRATRSGSILTA